MHMLNHAKSARESQRGAPMANEKKQTLKTYI